MKKFYIVGGGSSSSEDRVFLELGYEKTHSVKEANIVCFTGGEDISPSLYGEENVYAKGVNHARDNYEVSLFEELEENQWVVGICRGAQLITALHGGSLWQHQTNHAGILHKTTIFNKDIASKWGNLFVDLNSVHHQAIREVADGYEILAATNMGSTKYSPETIIHNDALEIEVVASKKFKSILMQAHPEFGHTSTKEFFQLLCKHYIGD